MSMGLYSREVVAAWLGKRVEEIGRMIEEDDLPAVKMPSAERARHKFSATQLTAWLNKRSNRRWTVDEVIAELERCVTREIDPALAEALGKVAELRALCEAAEAALLRSGECPRVMRALQDLAGELNPEAKAA